jgi:hypothetical protein
MMPEVTVATVVLAVILLLTLLSKLAGASAFALLLCFALAGPGFHLAFKAFDRAAGWRRKTAVVLLAAPPITALIVLGAWLSYVIPNPFGR